MSLEAKARDRYAECMAQRGGTAASCTPMLEDKKAAERAWSDERHRAAVDEATAQQQRQRDDDVLRQERARLNERFPLLRTCDEFAEFERVLAADGPFLTSQFAAPVARKRAERAHAVAVDVTYAMQRQGPERVAVLNDPTTALASVADVRAMIENVRCLDRSSPEAVNRLSAIADAWERALHKAVDDESRCRATPRCLDERAAKPVCDSLDQRRSAVQDIARERANPGGAVDLHFLHQLGQVIQDCDEQLPGLKADFKAARGKPFANDLCAKQP